VPALTYNLLRRRLGSRRFTELGGYIGIEGYMNSGKTALARCLSYDLCFPLVSLDDFVAIRGGDLAYPSRIARAKLSRELRRSGRKATVLVEGICLRAVLRHLPIRLTATVYLKRVSDAGLWHDGLSLEDFVAGNALDVDREEPFASDHRYHAAYLPHQKANFMLERRENDDGGLTAPCRVMRRSSGRLTANSRCRRR
jgi:hypothetical protein